MSAPTAPPMPPPPAPKAPPPPPKQSAGLRRPVLESKGRVPSPQKIVIYGPGGVGKTELSCNLQTLGHKVKMIDLDEGSFHQDVPRVAIYDWDSLREYLNDKSKWSDVDTIVIDSATKAEELAAEWTVANVPHEKGHKVTSLEGYGFGKGFGHLHDTMLTLIGDLDGHRRAGRSIILVCHECVATVPNPGGDDWIRFEPRLSSPTSGKQSVRHRVKEWADHLLFIGYDVAVVEEKAKGSGTRTIYPQERPTHWAKSRTLSEPIVYERGDVTIWKQIFGE